MKTILKKRCTRVMIIEDVLDLSRLEQERLSGREESFAPRALVEEIRDLISAGADEKGLTLKVRVDDDVPVQLHSLAARVRQILLNLVSNAVKFTDEGFVAISVYPCPTDPTSVVFKVSDTGIGFDPHHSKQLFEPFYQVSSSDRARPAGSGLGLAISHRLAHHLNGRLEAEGRPGEGSSFYLTLPIVAPSVDSKPHGAEPEAEPTRGDSIAAPLRGRIYVVDDNDDVRSYLCQALERAGATTMAFSGGADAVNTFTRSTLRSADRGRSAAPTPDVVLMDIQMPGQDGLETTRALRRAGFSGPVIAVTARALEADREICLAAGCTDYLAKPVSSDDLLTAVSNALDSPSLGIDARSALVVEDDADVGAMLQAVLKRMGCRAWVAQNAKEARVLFANHLPRFVIADLNLEGELDGLDLVADLRSEPRSEARFIGLSGMVERRDEALRGGFDHFLAKPVDLRALRSVLEA